MEKGAELRPLLDTTWDDLRNMLSAGQMMGQLIDADTGKHHKIEAHEWNRDDAGIAHITGWFSIPHAWGRFEGPVSLLKSDLRQRMSADPEEKKKGRAGRPKGSEEHDWEEGRLFAFKMLEEKGDFADPANRVDGWKTSRALWTQ